MARTELPGDRTSGVAVDRKAVEALHPLTILGVGVLVTAVALPESWRGWPYAPFPLLHASLAIIIPLWLLAGPSGPPWPEVRSHLLRQGRPIVAALVFIGGFVLLYSALLAALGKTRDPGWNLVVTYQELGKLFIARYGGARTVLMSYLLLGVWPMIGEELFYRGFLQRGLMSHAPLAAAAVATSILFGFRHAVQLTYLLPQYPLAAGVAYFVWAFGLSMIWCWVYARTGSLWLCMALHGVNLVLAPVALFALYP